MALRLAWWVSTEPAKNAAAPKRVQPLKSLDLSLVRQASKDSSISTQMRRATEKTNTSRQGTSKQRIRKRLGVHKPYHMLCSDIWGMSKVDESKEDKNVWWEQEDIKGSRSRLLSWSLIWPLRKHTTQQGLSLSTQDRHVLKSTYHTRACRKRSQEHCGCWPWIIDRAYSFRLTTY